MRIVTISALSAMMCAAASAEVIVFDNTAGIFVWESQIDFDPPFFGSHYLDITQGPEQADVNVPHAVHMELFPSAGTPAWEELHVVGSSGSSVARGPFQTFFDEKDEPLEVQFAQAFTAGQSVDGNADFGNRAFMRLMNFSTSPPVEELFPSNHFIGVEITLDGNTHYGWIEIEWTDGQFGDPQPIRWAYESEAGVPILIPAPGAAMVMLAVIGIAHRRRRHCSG